MILTRRMILAQGVGVAGLCAITPSIALATAGTDRRFVFIIQRGAADGLATVSPTGDPAYAPARGALADSTGARLDSMFTLHPSLVTTAALFGSQQARFHHAVASSYRDRSHFDAQNILETGGHRPFARQDGWMNRMLGLLPAGARESLALASTVPLALRGPLAVSSYAPSRLPQANDDLLQRVSALYADDAQLHPLWDSALRTRTLTSDIGGDGGRNGADLGRLAATLLTPADGARVMMIETGGWDTHSAQAGRLGAQLRGLDALIDALRVGLGPDGWRETMVVVATEFGRTVAVNGTGGTDHGTGAVAMVMGGALTNGGRVVADWPGLATGQLYDGRDLNPTLRLEQVIAQAVSEHYSIDIQQVIRVLFPSD